MITSLPDAIEPLLNYVKSSPECHYTLWQYSSLTSGALHATFKAGPLRPTKLDFSRVLLVVISFQPSFLGSKQPQRHWKPMFDELFLQLNYEYFISE